MGISICKSNNENNSSKILTRPSFHRTITGRLVQSNLNNLKKGEHYFSQLEKKISKHSSSNINKKKISIKKPATKNNINNVSIEDDDNNNNNIQQIKMSLTLKNINKISYSIFYKIKVFICNNKQLNEYKYLGETEYLSGNTMNFSMKFIFNYYFEKEQILKLKILSKQTENENNLIADEKERSIQKIVLASIMGKKNNSLSIFISESNRSNIPFLNLIITIKSNKTNIIIESCLKMELIINKFSQNTINDLYILINNFNDKKNWKSVYKSKEYSGYVNEPIHLDNIYLNPNSLCCDIKNKNNFIIIACIGNKDIGECDVNLSLLKKGVKDFDIINNIENIGKIVINYNEKKLFKFIDFLKNDLNIKLIIGIDFTLSNGKPSDPHSLHYYNNININNNNENKKKNNKNNLYEKSIRSFGDILSYYNNDQLFPVFGFGAELPYENNVNFCFPLNMKKDPNIQGIEKIINYYRRTVNIIDFSGPTYFSPILKKTKKIMENKKNFIYYILMILTDGNICDFNETCDILVECSHFPLSVVVIGIGNFDFNNHLDNNDYEIKNSFGDKAKRKLVQFVNFKNFNGDFDKLVEKVLGEIPQQIEDYFKLTNEYEKLGLI